MMKRMMLAAAVALLVGPVAASAQTGTINATAMVGEYMTITGAGDLAFGTVDRLAGGTLNPTTSNVTRTVTYNTDVSVSFDDVPTFLVGAESAYELPVTLTCAWDMFDNDWSTPSTCGSENFDLTVGTAVTQARLGFGGTITAAAVQNAIADTYSAQMTMIVIGR